MPRPIPLLLLTTVVSACAAPTPAPAPDPTTLMEADRAFARATAEGGGEGWADAFHPDGLQFLPSGRVLHGQDEIRSAMVGAFADPSSRLEWIPLEARVAAGDLGYTHGRYRVVRVEADGALTVESTGRYLTVWRRGEDGGWRVDADMGYPDPEPDPEAYEAALAM